MITTQIEIASPPAKVRKVLLDFDRIPEWHAGLVKNITPISTTDPSSSDCFAVGCRLHCEMEGFTFDSTITKNESSQFQWQGPPVYHLVAGLHTFEFKPSAITPGGTTFVQREEYSGPLAFLMTPSLAGRTIKGQFDGFNRDLKVRVESMKDF